MYCQLSIVKIFLWVLVSHKNYSLEHFQQQNNPRRKFSRLVYTYMIIAIVESLKCPKFNLRASVLPGGSCPQTPSISMLCMLIVLHTIDIQTACLWVPFIPHILNIVQNLLLNNVNLFPPALTTMSHDIIMIIIDTVAIRSNQY